MLAISLIVIGILIRLLPHAPNFTPVAAVALFGAVYLNRKYAIIVPLALMMISDLFIGVHNVMLFTWGSFILTAFLGFWVKKHKSIAGITFGSIASSILFYVISNFGVWAMGWYPGDLRGLIDCYVLALPFLRNFTLATLSYAFVFFGAYELVRSRVKGSRLAKVLLIE